MRHTRVKQDKTEKGLGSGINYHKQTPILNVHLMAGDISNKIPIPLSDGKTIVFTRYQKDVEKVKEFWEKKIKS